MYMYSFIYIVYFCPSPLPLKMMPEYLPSSSAGSSSYTKGVHVCRSDGYVTLFNNYIEYSAYTYKDYVYLFVYLYRVLAQF